MRHLKIESLPSSKTWIDRDTVMLHACFQILKDAVEKEHVDTHCDYETHKEFVDEVRFLYVWWALRVSRDTDDNIDDQYKTDDMMLSRLMKIRTQLWT